MARSRMQRGEKSDFTLEERLKRENRELKREVARLRKELDRVDITQFENLKDLARQQRREEKLKHSKERAHRDKWKCHKCGKGHMQLKMFPRRDGTFYYRICSNTECHNKTTMKKYTSEVENS